jgi:predicted transcriptional regulator
MRTIPVRLPDETAASVKRVAAMKGTTPGAVLENAWRWYLRQHGDEIARDLEALAESLRQPPLEGRTET